MKMSLDKVFKSLGKASVDIEGEDVQLLIKIGEATEYRKDMANLDKKYRNSDGEIDDVANFTLEYAEINKKYAKKFIMNANPQLEEENVNFLLEIKTKYIIDVLEKLELINLKAIKDQLDKEDQSKN